MATSSETSSCAGVTGVGFKFIVAINNLQSGFVVEGSWLCLVKEIISVLAVV